MKRPNIILISIDTLRADHLSCYGYHRETTPNIDRIAEGGVLFKNAYSTAVWTPPAHASMLTGLYPSQHGVVDQNKLDKNIPTIAEVLQRNGYRTAGFVNNSQVGALVGLDRGHDDFFEVWRGISAKDVLGRVVRKVTKLRGVSDNGAEKTNQLVLKWLQKNRSDFQPFYLFIHYIDVHNPLKAPYPFRFRYLTKSVRKNVDMKKIWKVAHNPLICFTDQIELTTEEIEALICLYDEEIAYLDHKIGELLDHLREWKLLDNTLLIITADHGEHFGEHNLYSHVASLYEPVIHIPFIVRYPDIIESGIKIEKIVQLVDIFPTILSVAHINYTVDNGMIGRDLLSVRNSEKYHEYIIAEWEGRIPYFVKKRMQKSKQPINIAIFEHKQMMIRKNNYKYILTSEGKEELYNLSSDASEVNNIINKERKFADFLKIILDKWYTSLREAKHEENPNEIDEDIKKNLEALGYM
ncbi:MAG: sulfatase [Candidatus Marinimicrobia bacterium]|nr:sulfatase [Candidatus Neomarinimicrobiota bacterium]